MTGGPSHADNGSSRQLHRQMGKPGIHAGREASLRFLNGGHLWMWDTPVPGIVFGYYLMNYAIAVFLSLVPEVGWLMRCCFCGNDFVSRCNCLMVHRPLPNLCWVKFAKMERPSYCNVDCRLLPQQYSHIVYDFGSLICQVLNWSTALSLWLL